MKDLTPPYKTECSPGRVEKCKILDNSLPDSWWGKWQSSPNLLLANGLQVASVHTATGGSWPRIVQLQPETNEEMNCEWSFSLPSVKKTLSPELHLNRTSVLIMVFLWQIPHFIINHRGLAFLSALDTLLRIFCIKRVRRTIYKVQIA